MVERQPGRPTVEEFSGAALRFITDNYPIETIHVSSGYFANVIQVKIGKAEDIAIIRREVHADGLPGIREPILDFAMKQLAWYQKSRKT